MERRDHAGRQQEGEGQLFVLVLRQGVHETATFRREYSKTALFQVTSGCCVAVVALVNVSLGVVEGEEVTRTRRWPVQQDAARRLIVVVVVDVQQQGEIWKTVASIILVGCVCVRVRNQQTSELTNNSRSAARQNSSAAVAAFSSKGKDYAFNVA